MLKEHQIPSRTTKTDVDFFELKNDHFRVKRDQRTDVQVNELVNFEKILCKQHILF